LKTAIVGFSDKTNFYTEDAIDDVDEAVKLVRGIKPANTPKENVFTAVEQATKRFMKYRRMRRNVMMIVVTDERGDDYASGKLESVIALTQRNGVRVYCVGNAAPFGRPNGYVMYTYPEDGYTVPVAVDQGPETVYAERLDLPFWGPRSGDLRQMTAGYGPYALTRLCVETKGRFLIADQSGSHRFDPHTMRNYLPDYRPIRDYEKQLVTNKAKGALVKVASDTFQKKVPVPLTVFRADTDNALRIEVTDAQKPFAIFDYELNELLGQLSQGEKDRSKLDTPRWQASYDLAMGRLLAMRVRAFGYQMMMAQMKSNPKSFEKEGSNTWQLVGTEDITTGPSVKKMAKKAKEYLTRVIDDHGGTPWALLAEREMSSPFGWKWQEATRQYADTGNGNGQENMSIQFADEERKKREEMRKMRAKKRAKPPL